jgi:hypothetical protein
MKNVLLIAAVHGVSGRATAEHCASLPGTRVYGLSRHLRAPQRSLKSSQLAQITAMSRSHFVTAVRDSARHSE